MNELPVDTHACQQSNKFSALSATAYTLGVGDDRIYVGVSCSAAAAHPMAASVRPDGGQYIGQQIFIDGFLGSRQCRVKVLLLSGPDQRGSAAGALDGVLVGQKADIGAMTLTDLDGATGHRTDFLADQLGYVRRRSRLSKQS
jgi:hypothetical protein